MGFKIFRKITFSVFLLAGFVCDFRIGSVGVQINNATAAETCVPSDTQVCVVGTEPAPPNLGSPENGGWTGSVGGGNAGPVVGGSTGGSDSSNNKRNNKSCKENADLAKDYCINDVTVEYERYGYGCDVLTITPLTAACNYITTGDKAADLNRCSTNHVADYRLCDRDYSD